MKPQKADIALVGLAVMGQNLVLNMNDHGYTVAVYNRTASKTEQFMQTEAAGRETILPAYSIQELVALLERPRKLMLMVKAGAVVDAFIDQIVDYLEPGDLIIDGGNSNYSDTERRTRTLAEQGILFIGTGISGGEEGARRGPSIMPGGSSEAWPLVKDIFQAIAAKTENNEVCCDWVGSGGAGHFVKMVHNGIEYGDMQLISEVYDLMRNGLGLDNPAMAEIFRKWNSSKLESYLIEITADILSYKDEQGNYVIDLIEDRAGQKGTGKWTGINSLELGIPVTLIVEAVFARSLSALKEQRVTASETYLEADRQELDPDSTERLIDAMGQALLAAKIVSYAQGFMLLKEAASQYGWELDYGSIAMMWRGGCIIRSVFLDNIKQAYQRDAGLENLLLDEYFSSIIDHAAPAWREVVTFGIRQGIALPAMSAALAFFDGYRTERGPANMLQAQRDYFGAHMYQRVDDPSRAFHHTNWTGTGGSTASSTYEV